MPVYANFDPYEGQVVSGGTTVELARKSRRIVIANDSANTDLKFRFNESENFGTIKPIETITFDVWVQKVFLQGAGVDYRLWAYG